MFDLRRGLLGSQGLKRMPRHMMLGRSDLREGQRVLIVISDRHLSLQEYFLGFVLFTWILLISRIKFMAGIHYLSLLPMKLTSLTRFHCNSQNYIGVYPTVSFLSHSIKTVGKSPVKQLNSPYRSTIIN